MSNFCSNCGAQLEPEMALCPRCGANVTGEGQAVAPAAEPAPRKKIKWWMIAVPVVLALVIAAACFWQPIAMAVAPEKMLGLAAAKTVRAMSAGFAGSPLRVLTATDPQKPSRLELDMYMKYDLEYMDPMEYSVDVTADPDSHRVVMGISEPSLGDVGLYMDSQGLAMAHNDFRDGAFYGLTFDTFRQDFLKSVLAPMAESDPEYLDQLEAMVSRFQKLMDSDEQETDYSAPYKEILADFLETLEVTAGEENTLHFDITKDQLMGLMEQLLDTLQQDTQLENLYASVYELPGYEAMTWEEIVQELRDQLRELDEKLEMTAHYTFHVSKDTRITKASCQMTLEMEGEKLELLMTLDLGRQDAVLTLDAATQEGKGRAVIKSTTLQEEDWFSHTFAVELEEDGEALGQLQLQTRWNEVTGALKFKLWTKDEYAENTQELELNLKRDGIGFVLSWEYQGDLGELLSPGYASGLEGAMTLSLRLTEAGLVEKPQWVNLDQWDEALATDFEEFMMELLYPDYGIMPLY